MLVKSIAQAANGRVTVVEENFGESALADRFGVTRYPAVFVNEVLVAKPKDFGFYGTTGSQGSGRYTPWLKRENQARFKADMERVVSQALRGELGSSDALTPDAGPVLLALPTFAGDDVFGVPVDSETLRDSVTVVEFWATWCPPCIKALPWLSDLQRVHEGRVQVLGVAVESPLEAVRKMAEKMELPFPNIEGTAELAVDFGDIVSVPTTFVFDRGGRLVHVFHGSPPQFKEELEALLTRLLKDEGRR